MHTWSRLTSSDFGLYVMFVGKIAVLALAFLRLG